MLGTDGGGDGAAEVEVHDSSDRLLCWQRRRMQSAEHGSSNTRRRVSRVANHALSHRRFRSGRSPYFARVRGGGAALVRHRRLSLSLSLPRSRACATRVSGSPLLLGGASRTARRRGDRSASSRSRQPPPQPPHPTSRSHDVELYRLTWYFWI